MAIDPTGNTPPSSSWSGDWKVSQAPKAQGTPNVNYQTGDDYISKVTGQNRPQLLPGGVGNRENMIKAMASFEDLLILLTELGRQTRLSERQNQLSALQEKVAQLEASAEKKLEAADKMRTGAIVSLVMTVTAAAVSLVGAGIQTGQMLKGMSKINKSGLSLQNIKEAPGSNGPKIPDAKGPDVKAPGPKGPDTKVPDTKAPDTKAPDVKGPDDAGGKKDGSFEGVSKDSLVSLRGGELNKLSNKTQITGQFSQGVAQILQGIGSFVQSWMQADSQSLQAEAEKLQALAEQIGVFMQQAQNQEADFKEFMQKVNDILRDFIAAQQKMTEAVSH